MAYANFRQLNRAEQMVTKTLNSSDKDNLIA